MNLRFLCANHRQWLTSDIKRAVRAWSDWTERGAELCERGEYVEAIPFLGCAFELASHLLAERKPDYAVATLRFTECARQLIEAYRQQGETGFANYVLVGSSSRLARELADKRNYRLTADCIQTLYSGEAGVVGGRQAGFAGNATTPAPNEIVLH